MNCLSVFDHFVKLALKELRVTTKYKNIWFIKNKVNSVYKYVCKNE